MDDYLVSDLKALFNDLLAKPNPNAERIEVLIERRALLNDDEEDSDEALA